MLASFHLEWPEGSTLEGPLASKIEAPFVMCQYRSKTPYDAEASVWWTTLPYFGPGYPETIIPSGVVSSALQRCASPKTMAPGGGLVQLAHYAIGTWLRCPGGDTQGWGWSGDGVVLRADGTWHTLQLESDGRLSLTTECLQGGLWGFVENDAIPSTMGQINFMTETGEWMTIETFYNHGTRMTIESMADFVRAQ